jgi:glycerol kinase
MAGAVVQWMRDQMKMLKDSQESEKAIKGLKDTNGVYLVPAFTGLGAPYWKSEARGLITGITRGTTLKHLIRAGLEAIAYQTKDVFDVMEKAFERRIPELKVDGGACQNDFLMQFQADMLGCRILRPRIVESTVQGAAYLAGITTGLWHKEDLDKLHKVEKVFRPKMLSPTRARLYQGWLEAVKRTLA